MDVVEEGRIGDDGINGPIPDIGPTGITAGQVDALAAFKGSEVFGYIEVQGSDSP